MEESEKELKEKLQKQIKQLIQAKRPIVLTTYTFPFKMEVYMEQVLTVFLEIMQQDSITDYVVYFVKELVGNAKKANAKRVYFKEKNLDIQSECDYERGMKSFKSEIFGNKKHYLALQEKEGLYIRLKLWKENNVIKIEVSNNVLITAYEEKRMLDKLEMGKQYSSLEDALTQAVDDSEGGGLGLIILVLMMKKMGVNREQIWIQKTESETKIGVEIPIKP